MLVVSACGELTEALLLSMDWALMEAAMALAVAIAVLYCWDGVKWSEVVEAGSNERLLIILAGGGGRLQKNILKQM